MLWQFFLISLKAGALAFGGGYAMIGWLHFDLVTHYGWLTEAEFSNAVAIGQITPGPLMLMIAYVGFKLAGLPGAVLGTAGLFMPCAVMVLAVARLCHRFKDAPAVQGAMRGIALAVVALLASVVFDLGRGAMLAPMDWAIALAAVAAAGPLKLDPIAAVLGAGAVGLARHFIAGG
jgi:chromate transporter